VPVAIRRQAYSVCVDPNGLTIEDLREVWTTQHPTIYSRCSGMTFVIRVIKLLTPS